MNYKNETLRTLQEIGKAHTEYSLGDLLFSCFQEFAVKEKQSLNFLRNISDEDLYTKAEKTLKTLISQENVMTDEEWEQYTSNE